MRLIIPLCIFLIWSASAGADTGPAISDRQWHSALTPNGTPGRPVALAENGKIDYRIVIPQLVTTMEQKAADDLAKWLNKTTGVP